MKITTLFKSALLITMLGNGSASAYSPEEKNTVCKKPRFTDFTLTTYNASEDIEVAPESEFYFRVSAWADPSTISLTVKNKPLKFTIESNSSFHKVKAKLPAELTGQFARINTGAKALLGCDDQAGWLVKVAKK